MAMKRTVVETRDAPAAIGPYSQAVVAGGLVFVSGQAGLDPVTGKLVAGGVEAEMHQALRNLKAVLAAAGADLSHVVKVVLFLKDMDAFKAANDVYTQYFDRPFPARTTVAVKGLPASFAVELDVTAIAGPTLGGMK